MKHLKVPLAVGAVIAMALLFQASCMTMHKTLVDVPGAAESPYFEKVHALQRGMTVEEVRSVMGPPSEDKMFADVWHPIEGESMTQIKVLYAGSKATRATWIDLGDRAHFVIF